MNSYTPHGKRKLQNDTLSDTSFSKRPTIFNIISTDNSNLSSSKISETSDNAMDTRFSHSDPSSASSTPAPVPASAPTSSHKIITDNNQRASINTQTSGTTTVAVKPRSHRPRAPKACSICRKQKTRCFPAESSRSCFRCLSLNLECSLVTESMEESNFSRALYYPSSTSINHNDEVDKKYVQFPETQ